MTTANKTWDRAMFPHVPAAFDTCFYCNEPLNVRLTVPVCEERFAAFLSLVDRNEKKRRVADAAPDLLDAAKIALDYIITKGHDSTGKIRTALSAAIRKAEGKE